MGAGLVFAVAGREILSISDHVNASPGIGLWISFAAGGEPRFFSLSRCSEQSPNQLPTPDHYRTHRV